VSTTLLAIHIGLGTLGILLGPTVIWQETRRLARGQRANSRAGAVYNGTVLLICVSAIVLIGISRPDLWLLVPVAAVSYGLALLGRIAGARPFPIWSHAYVHGIGGSYIALVTALLVVGLTVDGPLKGAAEVIPWVLPAAIGTPLIELWRRHLLRVVAKTNQPSDYHLHLARST
jgi:hypothetical protein